MAGEIAAAGAGMQAQQRGSTTSDLSSAFAAFLGGMRQRDREREAQALEEAKLAVEQRNAESNAVNAAANMMHGQANVMNAQTTADSQEFYRNFVAPAEIAASNATTARANIETAVLESGHTSVLNALDMWSQELRMYGVDDATIAAARRSPYEMSKLVERTSAQYNSEIRARGAAAEPMARELEFMQELLRVGRDQIAQAEQAWIGFRAQMVGDPLRRVEFVDESTGEKVNASFLQLSTTNPAMFEKALKTLPEYQALEKRIADTKKNYEKIIENAMNASIRSGQLIQAALETVDGQAGRELGAAGQGYGGDGLGERLWRAVQEDYANERYGDRVVGGEYQPIDAEGNPMRPGSGSGSLDAAFGAGGDYDRLDTPLSPGAGRPGDAARQPRYEPTVRQPTAEGMDSVTILGLNKPDTLAALMPELQRVYPNIAAQLEQNGVVLDSLAQAVQERTRDAYARAARELENYRTPDVLMQRGPEPALNAIREALNTARYGNIESAESPRVTQNLLMNAHTLASMGMTAEQAERNLTNAQRDNPIWQFVKANWRNRIPEQR